METINTKYYYAVRELNEESELIFKGENLVSARQKAMKTYKSKLLSIVNGSCIKRNTAFPVSVYLVEDINGKSKYYPITGKEPHEMEKGWHIESRIMQEQSPLNAFFD